MKNNWIRLFAILFIVNPFCIHAQALSSEQSTVDQRKDEISTLTLDDVIALALRDNRSLISSAYGIEGQHLSVDSAQSDFDTKVFPQASAFATEENRRIGGGISVEKRFMPGPIASIRPEVFRIYGGDDDQAYGSEVAVSLTIPLLRGFGKEINMSGVHFAQYSLRSAKRSHHLVKINTVLDAVSATYDIVQQRELVSLYTAQTERFQAHAVMAKAREKIGLATPIDVYRAQIRLKDAQNSLNRSQESLRNAGDRLKIVLASPLEQAVKVVAPLECPPVDISIAKAVETALKHRVELKQADEDLEEAQRSSRLSKNDLHPQLDLVTNYTRLGNGDVPNGLTQLTDEFWSLRLTSETDWARKKEKTAYKQSLLNIKRTKLSRFTRIDSIKREVRQIYDALDKTQERMEIRRDQIKQARGKMALANIKFKHGMADNFDLIEAETELQEARTNLLASKIEFIVGTYRLRAAIGTLIE